VPHPRLFPDDELLHKNVQQVAEEARVVAENIPRPLEHLPLALHPRRALRCHRSGNVTS